MLPYVLPDKLMGLTKDDLTGFPRLCPDFVVELLSISDSLSKSQQKMERWIENGASLGWLIDPYEKKSTSTKLGRNCYREWPCASRRGSSRGLYP